MIRFIIESYIFKKVLIATIALIVVIFAGSKLFDMVWGTQTTLALTDLTDVYMPPQEYDNIKKIRMSFLPPDMVCIEGNLKLKIAGSSKGFQYFDTARIIIPTETNELRNKIFIQFEESKYPDSVYIVISKTGEKDKYWRQIFLSSVMIKTLNKTGDDTAGFRIKKPQLVPQPLLENNDTLINMALNYYNSNKDTLTLGDCGMNSATFRRICRDINLPCRIIGLQGGDEEESGFEGRLGYPTHAVCEVYSSKFQKWYVIDPSFGLRFRDEGNPDFMNAVEISDKSFFFGEKKIVQDSVLFTKRTTLEKDYFKYYENVIFRNDFKLNYLLKKMIQHLYAKFSINAYLFSNITPGIKNAKNYIIFKSLMYLIISIMYTNFIMFIMIKRLMKTKKPHNKS